MKNQMIIEQRNRADKKPGKDDHSEEDEDKEEVKESKVWTTERENLLNENRFGKRRNDLFQRLMTSWIKK